VESNTDADGSLFAAPADARVRERRPGVTAVEARRVAFRHSRA